MYAIAIHGGAGTILKEKMPAALEKEYLTGLSEAINAGFFILENGGTALDAVEISVKKLEDNELFNAGKGSVFTSDGTQEMDASIMDGKTLNAGAVTGLKNIKNPIHLARRVMEKSNHLFLSGQGAEKFAREQEIRFESDEYFYTKKRYEQWRDAQKSERIQLDHFEEKKSLGTVGAVALDNFGNLASATSTGGLTNKNYGRIGDTPIIGAGTYANNKNCAVSCTGDGEYFIRSVAAYDVFCLMEYKNFSLSKACHFVVMEKLKELGGDGGLIAIDKSGNIEMVFNSEGMYRASRRQGQELEAFIW